MGNSPSAWTVAAWMKSVTEMSDPRFLRSARSVSRSVMSTATVTVKVGTDVPSVSRRAMVWRMRLSVSPGPDMAAAGSAGAERAAGTAASAGWGRRPTARRSQSALAR